MKARWIVMLIVAMLLLASCSPLAAEKSTISYDNAAPEALSEMGVSPDTQYITSGNGSTIVDSTVTDQVERVVIKNASLSIVVDDPVSTLALIGQKAEDSGGFIVTSNLYKSQTEQGLEIPGADITIRVPAEKLNQILDEIKALLKDPVKDVQSENILGEDVTREYTDLQSRLNNLEQAKTKLEEIMDAAYQTEDVLSVYNELTRVSEQIEVLKGQIQYYNEASKLSSIAIRIVARESIKVLTIGGWQPAGVARNAIQTLIDTLKFFVNAGIWIVLYLLPVALSLFIPVFLIYLGIRWIVRRGKQKKQSRAVQADSTLTETDQEKQ